MIDWGWWLDLGGKVFWASVVWAVCTLIFRLGHLVQRLESLERRYQALEQRQVRSPVAPSMSSDLMTLRSAAHTFVTDIEWLEREVLKLRVRVDVLEDQRKSAAS